MGRFHAQIAIEQIGQLKGDQLSNAKIQLVAAYANYSVAKYQSCLAAIAEATINLAELPESDAKFLESLNNACNYHLGSIDRDEFDRRENELLDKGGLFQLQHELDHLRYSVLTERDDETRTELLKKLGEVIEQLVSHSDATDSIVLHAQIIQLFAEGQSLVMGYTRELMLIQMREGMARVGGPPMGGNDLGSLRNRLNEWMNRANDVVRTAESLKHPVLLGDAVSARATVGLSLHLNADLESITNGESYQLPEKARKAFQSDIQFAIDVYSASKNIEGELRCKMLMVDLLELVNDVDLAREIANDVLPVARAFGLQKQELSAREFVEGTSLRQAFVKKIEDSRNQDEDFLWATHSDEEMRDMAKQTLAALNLPVDRLTNLEIDCISLRDIAAERVSWCRHIGLMQDLRHTNHPSTHYAQNPNRICVCELHKIKSQIENPDASIIILAFKSTHCESCKDRSPKTDSQSET